MSEPAFKNTTLWKDSFELVEGELYYDKKALLSAEFNKFRLKVSILVAKISSDLPSLTSHDIGHLDALWKIASIICGEKYPINPLEAFVFGGAVLLHDSALCFDAYEGGVDGVRSTTIWKDSFSFGQKSNPDSTTDELNHVADFDTLRHLHADQAEDLCSKSWTAANGTELFLIEDVSLRDRLGKLIGRIAASHHWDIEEVAIKFQTQFNALAEYPTDWRINPLKLACMLRCADAAHLDSERAPDFLYALTNPQGVSGDHWSFQNKLSGLDIDQNDNTRSSLLFNSTSTFLEKDSDAWWVAYEAICVVDSELRACDALFNVKNIPELAFQAKKVTGSDSPAGLNTYIRSEGWTPHLVKVQVSDIEGLIKNLGGDRLYGVGVDKLGVVVRELIQNARDSIHARRVLDPDFEGRITVRINNIENEDWLFIEDDGIGMSKGVLTGPLLDFGTSFWSSSLVRREHPGLMSSDFSSIGQFGIGFYSVFMCSDEVRVSSKKSTDGLADVCQIYFKNGISLRPILRSSAPENFPHNISTQVAIRLKDGLLKNGGDIEVKRAREGKPGHTLENLIVSFGDYVQPIFAGIDVSVFYSTNNLRGCEIHPRKIDKLNQAGWLKSISFAKYQSKETEDYIDKNADRLRPMTLNGKCYGYAAISSLGLLERNFLTLSSVGGLCANVNARSAQEFIGYIDFQPNSAARNAGEDFSSDEAFEEWLSEQIKLIDINDFSNYERFHLGRNICQYGRDPIDIAMVFCQGVIGRDFLYFNEIANLSRANEIVLVRSMEDYFMEDLQMTHALPVKVLILPLNSGLFQSLEMSGELPKHQNSILGCIYRSISRLGLQPKITVLKNAAGPGGNKFDAILVNS
ncbi:MAG: hypothetical protein ACI93R_003268 [Flavobacteriales bacterium]|jgi:hypothetical protein